MKRLFIAVLMIFSIKTAFAQIITTAEYFIDTDLGPGNGTPVSVGTQGIVVSFPIAIPINLAPGFHWLGVRVKDSDGKWGLFERRSFYISQIPTDLPIITHAEYFFDTDPGVGNGTNLPIQNTGFSVSQNFVITVPTNMSAGTHRLAIRVKDQAGHWSLFQRDSIVVGGATTISCPANVVIAAATGQCSSVVNNIDPIVSPQGSSYTYTLTGATTGSGAGTASGKTFNAGVTTVTYALNSTPSINCSFTVTVNANVTPTININASGTNICNGEQVTFTTTPLNGGSNPSYQWKLNGNNIPGATGTSLITSSLANGDVVSVAMTSSIGCANPQTVLSNTVLMNVNSNVVPLVSIGSSGNTICTGTTVNFMAGPSNGGPSPTYQWKLNGNNIPGATNSTYQTSTLVNGDKVSVVMTSSLSCASPQTTTSPSMTITVTPTLPPSVYVEYSATTICAGTTATFFVSPGNGGATPSYQWKVNGNNAGTNSDTFSSSTLNNGDNVTVTMTSSLGCASPQSVTSTPITMTVLPSTPPAVNINASATAICPGSSVTFNVTSVTAGAGYQWQLNGNNIQGATSTTYQTSSLQNGDKVKVIMTPSSLCYPSSPITSNDITMSVNAVTPSVSIDASATTICNSQLVTFTATPTNGGNDPGYEWTLNGNVVGNNSNTYQTSTLHNGDVIKVAMESSLSCTNPGPVYSNTIVMTVGSGVTPTVSISASAIDICAGQQVTFTATPTNGGNSPTYQWKLNGNNVGSNSATYQTSSLANADTIKVVMTSSIGCASTPTATSNSISMDVSTSVTPSVSIYASQISICTGMLVKFFANPVNGGNAPVYQWKLNGNNVGTNSGIFQSTTLNDNDVVSVVMTSSLSCAGQQPVESNTVTVTVGTVVTPSVSIEADNTTICSGTMVTFTARPTNGGNTPLYRWLLNGNDVGDISDTYQSSTLANGDSIVVIMTSSLECAIVSTAKSNMIKMSVTQPIIYYVDKDRDGFGDAGSTAVLACGPEDGLVTNKSDCNDNNASIHPGAAEVCGNGIDDNCNGNVDENCTEGLPVLQIKTYPSKEGDAGFTILEVEVRLDRPAISAVRLNYTTSSDDAIAGSDYVTASGILIIPQGVSSGTIQLKIIGDLLKESNERFWLNFSNPVNVVLPGDPRSRIMIIDDDKGKPNSASQNKDAMTEARPFKIPTVVKRNSIWMIPQIGNYENEILIMNVQGQVVNRFINYRNQTPLGNLTVGIYFYQIRIMENPGQYKYYSGRLLITE